MTSDNRRGVYTALWRPWMGSTTCLQRLWPKHRLPLRPLTVPLPRAESRSFVRSASGGCRIPGKDIHHLPGCETNWGGGILKPISWSSGGGLRVSQRGHFPRPHPCKWHFIHPNPSSILCVNSRGADGENRRQRRRKQAVFSVQEETEISRPFSFGGSQKLLMFKKKKKRQLFLHNMMSAGVLQLGRNNSRIRVKVESRWQMHNS